MAKIAARNARILLGGRDASCHSNNAVLNMTVEAPEVTTFCDTNRVRLHGGIRDAEFSFEGFVTTGASEMDVALNSVLSASVVTSFFPYGYTASQNGYSFIGMPSAYNSTYALADAAGFSVTVPSGSGLLAVSRVLWGGSANQSSDGNMSSVDFSGSSGESYVVFHVTELSGGGTPKISACVQHSLDDSTFVTIWAGCVVVGNLGEITGACISSAIASASRYRRLAFEIEGTAPSARLFITSASIVRN